MDISLNRLYALIYKETVQLLRDRRLLLFIFGLPILELFLYGFAVHMTVYHIPMAVVDQSQDSQSRDFIHALVNSQYFDWTMDLPSQADAGQAIDRGEVKVAVVIPPDFNAALLQGNASVLIMLDGTDNAAVQSGYSAASMVAQNEAMQLTALKISPGGGAGSGALPITASTQVLYNPDLIDIWLILPGLVGLILQTLGITQAALILVRDRELGTIEPILATPVRPVEIILSKMVPLLGICLLTMAVVVGLGVFWFGVPFQGSLFLYFWMSLLFIASCLGLGLLISVGAQTQMEASTNGLLFMLLGMLLSGFMYPTAIMPAALRWIAAFIPVTYFIRISRAIFTKGVGLNFIWSDALVLLVYTLVIIYAASRSFKQRLD
jgi:ABC-2 type transport system permease protein